MSSVGPQLPPHLGDKRKHDEGGESRSLSPDSATKRPRVIGPLPPPAPLIEHPSMSPQREGHDKDEDSESGSDDDGFGPALPAAESLKTSTAPQPQATQSQTTAPAKRDEWMTIAPTHGDWSARVDPTKLKNRKFGTGKGPSITAGEADSWHETPEQKQARLQREILGIKDDSKTRSSRSGTSKGDPEDDATRRRMKEYSEARGPSLYQAHQNTTQPEKDDDPSARAFDREKDIGGGLQINSTQRRDMMKRASDIGSRFSSAKYL